MNLTDQKIFVQLAKKGVQRAVDVADAADMELADASRALRDLVDVGDVVTRKADGANGVTGMVYELSETFKAGRDYQVVLSIIGASTTAPTPPAPIAEMESFVAREEVAPLAPAAAESSTTLAGANRAEIGVAFILKHGSVPDADLRDAMGIRKGQYPSAWLTAAIKNGLVNKDGKNWTPGPGQPLPPASQFNLAGSTPGARNAPTQIPAPAPAPAPAAPAGFRIGCWSDGAVEMQRGGVTVLELTEAEHQLAHRFMMKMS